jgi:predicted flap endonuclease-1-like 5' DNA nuclease
MVDPVLVGGAVAGVGVLTAAGYAYLSGDDASAGVDVDNDGDNEVSYTFEGNNNEHQAADGLDVGAEADDEAEDTNADVEEQADPTPEVVTEKSGLTDIKGVGPTRAERLGKAGFSNPEDIYYASDENLEGVKGIGPHAVSQMREDIDSIEDDTEGNDGESTEEPEAAQSEDKADTDQQSSSTEDEDDDGSDSQSQTDGSGNESDEDPTDDEA